MDWAGLIRVGLGLLKLRPEQFWRLTPIELLTMMGMAANEAPLNRTRLEALVSAFPDNAKDTSYGS